MGWLYLTFDAGIAFCTVFFLLCLYAYSDKDLWYLLVGSVVFVGIIPRTVGTLRALYGRKFGVDVIAIAAIVSALWSGNIVAAAVVLLMLFTGSFLERYAGDKARASLSRLLTKVPTTASVHRNGSITTVSVDKVLIREILSIKQGEVIPLDGVVSEGSSSLDESMITGESVLRDVTIGDRVVSGSINDGDSFLMKVSTVYEDSVFRGIVRLVEKAEQDAAPMVRLADTYSGYFTLFTIAFATIAFFKDPKLVTAVLVVATPCPLILAAPIAFIAGMSKAAKNGIIVKYGGVFEALQKSKAFFFDKTGTLTLGTPRVVGIHSLRDGYTERNILRIASSLEQGSAHILAESIVEKAKEESLALATLEHLKEEIGKGTSATMDGKHFLIGSISYLVGRGVKVTEEHVTLSHTTGTPAVYLAEGEELIGSISFSDTVRKNAAHVLKELRSLYHGVHLVLLTGDKEERAKEIGKKLGLNDVQAECLPEDKLILVKEYEKKGKPVVMIGDGVNDAPSLAQASVGVALSSHGGTVATDIADAVIMVDDLEKIVTLVKISRRTTTIAKQSMFFGMGLSILAMGAAFGGYLPPIQGALLQEGIDMIMIVNALRAL